MVNKVILLGRLGGDPEIRYTMDGKPVAIFNVATNEVYVKENGDREERTEWHRVIAFGKLAEACGALSKGEKVYVEGRIRTREYEDKTGVKKRVYEIFAVRVVFLGVGVRKDSGFGGQVDVEGLQDNDEDIPF